MKNIVAYGSLFLSIVNDSLHIEIESEEDKDKYYELKTAKLSDLSPNTDYLASETVEITRHFGFWYSERVVLKCSLGVCWKFERKTTKTGTGEVEEKTSMSDETRIPICDEDTAERLSKAFAHLIKKSGGKQSLF